jgi:hypothetical protein
MWRMIPLIAVAIGLAVWANTPRETPREAEVPVVSRTWPGTPHITDKDRLDFCLDLADAAQLDSYNATAKANHGPLGYKQAEFIDRQHQMNMQECRLRYGR